MTKKLIALSTIFMLAFPFAVLADDPPKPAEAAAATETAPATAAPATAAPATAAPATEPQPPDVPGIGDDVGGFIDQIVKAFNAKDWGIFAGLVIMALVWILKKFVWKKLAVAALPWVSAGAGIAVAVATGLAAGLIWWKAILNGLTVGTAASGLWSLIGKKIFGKNDKD